MGATRGLTGGLLSMVVAGGLAVAPAQAVEVHLHAGMHPAAGFPSARGTAEYHADHGDRELEVHLRGIKKLAGKRVVVRVHGAFVGRMLVSSHGTAHLSRHGVPRCTGGTVVRVRTGSGVLVAHGTLRPAAHHDGDD